MALVYSRAVLPYAPLIPSSSCRKEEGGSALIDLLPRKDLTHIPSSIGNMQKQILWLFRNVLDIDLGKKASVQKLMANCCSWEVSDSLNTFQFCTLPMKYVL